MYPNLKKPSAKKLGKSRSNPEEGSPSPADLGGSFEVITSDFGGDEDDVDALSSSSRRPMSDIDDEDGDDSAYEVEDDGDEDGEWDVVPDTPPSSAKKAKLSQDGKSSSKSQSKRPHVRVSIARKPKGTPHTPAKRGKKRLSDESSAAHPDESKHDFSDDDPENHRYVQKEFETPLRDPQANALTPEKPSCPQQKNSGANNNNDSDSDDCVFVGESPAPSRSNSIAAMGGDSSAGSRGGGSRRRSRRTPKTPERFVSRLPPPDSDDANGSEGRDSKSAAKSNPESINSGPGSSGDLHSPIPKPSARKAPNLDSSIVSDFDMSLLSESDFEQQRDIEREIQRGRRPSTVNSRPESPFTPSRAEIVAAPQDESDPQNQSFTSAQGDISILSENTEPNESDFDSAQFEDDDEDGDSDFEIEDGAGARKDGGAVGKRMRRSVNADSDSNFGASL